MGIPTIGLVSPLVVTGGFGKSAVAPSGGLRLGGRAYSSESISTSGGVRFVGTSLAPRTFLAALVELLRADPALSTAVGGRIYSTWPGAQCPLPFVLIEGYVENQPGEESENNSYTLNIRTYAFTGEEARRIGKLVQAAADTPGQNVRSVRQPLYWKDGYETDSWRDPTMPPTRSGKTAFGKELFQWSVQYTWNYKPFFQVPATQ